MTRSHLGGAYRPDLDGLRGIAILGVVAFHADARLAPGGFSGVDVFFVLSGYLISRLVIDGLARGTFRFGPFFARRLVRLGPALALVLIACWAVGWLTLLPAEYAQLGAHIAAGAGFVANLAFWRESGHYFDTDAASKPLLHLWSLGVEEQFYLLWPLCLAAAWWRRVPLLPVVLTLGAVSFLINIATVGTHASAAFYLPPARLWELAVGGALACMSLARTSDTRLAQPAWLSRAAARVPGWLPAAAGASGLLLIGLSWALLGGRTIPGWWALLPVLGLGLVIGAGPRAWTNRTVLSHPVLTFVGLISYPLYLWHWPVLTFTRIVTSRDPGWWMTAAGVAGSVVLAWLTYRFVEQPVQAEYRAGGRVWLPVRLVAALAIAAAVGTAVLVWSPELPARFPASVQYLVDFQYDYASAYREGRCYLSPGQAGDAFADECVDAPGRPGTPLVVLWGDSHAAHLYPGLRRLQAEMPFRLAQFTASACPPLRALDVPLHPSCREINESVLVRIRGLRPQVCTTGGAMGRLQDLESRRDRESPSPDHLRPHRAAG